MTSNEKIESGAAQEDGLVGGIKLSDVTVVMATYDLKRWQMLTAALESLFAAGGIPARQIIICVDQNEELYHRVRDTWSEVTAVLNTGERGASHSRNVGAKLVETPFMVFADDDIRVSAGWLPGLLEPFADPTVIGTGGAVEPSWQSGVRPRWFPQEFDWVVGASYRGMPTTRCEIRNVWAENMAVRTHVFNMVGGFRSGFGKLGAFSQPEDTDLCIRMAATDDAAKWVYVPDALVDHHVPESRMTFPYFLRRIFHEGAGKFEMAQLLGNLDSLESERDYLRKTLPSGIAADLWSVVRNGDSEGLFKAGAIMAGIIAAGLGATAGALRRLRAWR